MLLAPVAEVCKCVPGAFWDIVNVLKKSLKTNVDGSPWVAQIARTKSQK